MNMKKRASLFIVLLVILMSFTACKKEEVVDEPVASESATPSEEVKETVSEIVDGIQTASFDTYDELKAYANSIGDTVIIAYSFLDSSYEETGQAILYEDAHYKIPEHYLLSIVSQKNIKSAYSNISEVGICPIPLSAHEKEWFIEVPDKVAFYKVPITIEYEDGIIERIEISFTKEWFSLPLADDIVNVGAIGDYSAEAVMSHIDDLTAKYQYNKQEHIRALVIAANLEFISASDLETILDTYSYTIDEVAALYEECILDNNAAFQSSFIASQGRIDELLPEETFENRIPLNAVIINPIYAEFAKHYDFLLVSRSIDKLPRDYMIEFRQAVTEATGEFSEFENFAYGYAWGVFDVMDPEHFTNPFNKLKNNN